MKLDKRAVRIAIVANDMTQEEFAKCIDVSRSTINGICNGRSCSDATAYKIATALGVDIEKLIEK